MKIPNVIELTKEVWDLNVTAKTPVIQIIDKPEYVVTKYLVKGIEFIMYEPCYSDTPDYYVVESIPPITVTNTTLKE